MNKCFALGFVLLTACGDIAHETPDAQVAPKADAVTVDSPVQLPLGPFSAPIPIAELNTVATERGPILTGDMLELYFVSARVGSAVPMSGCRRARRSRASGVHRRWSRP